MLNSSVENGIQKQIQKNEVPLPKKVPIIELFAEDSCDHLIPQP